MFTPEEWMVMRQGLDVLTITGRDAKNLAVLQIKVEKQAEKAQKKKEKELKKVMK